MISVSLSYIYPDIDTVAKKLQVKSTKEQTKLELVHNDAKFVLDPKYLYAQVDFDEMPINKLMIESKDLRSFIKDSISGFVVISTIGSAYKKLSDKYNADGDMLSVMYLDRIASDTVENLAEYSAVHIFEKQYSANEHMLSKRYSPGYGDLPLERQSVLFDLFKNKTLEVELSENFFMEPEKSISYIVGVLAR